MATLQATTTSDAATVTDPEAALNVCEQYDLRQLDCQIHDGNQLTISGYAAFEAYPIREDGMPDYDSGIKTTEFLESLSEYVAEGSELDIHCVGHTKQRFPVLARRWVVRPDEVLYTDLNGLSPVKDANTPDE